jgi:hypothetical protein
MPNLCTSCNKHSRGLLKYVFGFLHWSGLYDKVCIISILYYKDFYIFFQNSGSYGYSAYIHCTRSECIFLGWFS